MGFHDIQFPTSISYGSSGGPGYKHQVVSLPTGAEEIVATQSLPRWRFRVSERVKSNSSASELKRFYAARGGLSNSFRFKDWLDYRSSDDGESAATDTDQEIGIGDGTTRHFQLVKEYGDAAGSVLRTITKPVASTTVIAVDGTPTASGWSVNTTTGLVTFTVAPTAAQVITAGFEFDCEVRFDAAVDEWLEITHDEYDSLSLSAPLIEKAPAAPVESGQWYGGASALSVAADITLTKANGRDITLTPTGAFDAYLPPKGTLETGGAHFYLHNTHGSLDVTIKDVDDDSTVATLTDTAGATPNLIIVLGVTAAGARKWYALG